ncbi:IclR family transcriptional regulator [Arthrobacter sulfonylureivorans]|uniref:IclR family transcriptional regulator n=1 Tax=Arthrobacter sulfonylureivorans TaxID=2486855 RepID=UPI0039E3015C
MSMALSRGLQTLEIMAGQVEGLPLNEIVVQLGLPKSAAHRTLTELVDLGYLRQDHPQGNYVLSMKVVSIAQRHLAQIPLVDLAKPFLDRLAASSGELSRLSIVDGASLVWVAKTQGAKSALRYDPDAGQEVKLSCSASGLAWLSTLSDEEAIALVELQGYADSDSYGPAAPRNAEEYLRELNVARERGYGYVSDSFEPGVSAVAVPIVPVGAGKAAGVLNLCGPSVRLTAERSEEFVPELKQAAAELALLFNDQTSAQGAVFEATGKS